MTIDEAKEWITIMHNVAIQIIDNPKFTEATKIAVEYLEEQSCQDCDYKALKIKLENAEDIIRGLQEDLRDAREKLRWR